MNQAPEIYVTFPSTGYIDLQVGDTYIDFLNGKAILPDGSIRTLANRITEDRLLRSVLFLSGYSINADILLENEATVYRGLIPHGQFSLTNISFDSIKITATVVTRLFLVASTDPSGARASEQLPSAIIDGSKSDISITAAQLTVTSTSIFKGILVKVRSLGTGSYIALGNSVSQSLRLSAVGDAAFVDWVDDVSKIYVITDVGTTGSLEYNGG